MPLAVPGAPNPMIPPPENTIPTAPPKTPTALQLQQYKYQVDSYWEVRGPQHVLFGDIVQVVSQKIRQNKKGHGILALMVRWGGAIYEITPASLGYRVPDNSPETKQLVRTQQAFKIALPDITVPAVEEKPTEQAAPRRKASPEEHWIKTPERPFCHECNDWLGINKYCTNCQGNLETGFPLDSKWLVDPTLNAALGDKVATVTGYVSRLDADTQKITRSLQIFVEGVGTGETCPEFLKPIPKDEPKA